MMLWGGVMKWQTQIVDVSGISYEQSAFVCDAHKELQQFSSSA